MKKFAKAALAVAAIYAVGFVGCGKPSPPDITAASSGISITNGPNLLDQWPGWRGPDRNGVAPDQPLLTTWSESNNVLWRADVPGRGHASPVVVGDLVLLATAVPSEGRQLVLAYDRETGHPRWETVVHDGGVPSERQIHSKGTHANSSVACDGERVYATFFNDGAITLTALDMKGEAVYQKQLGDFQSKFGYAPSPILYKSLVIVNVDTQGGFLTAIDAETGETVWRVGRPSQHTYSSPSVVAVGGADQLIVSGAEKVISYDPETGEQNWVTDATADSTCGTAVALGDYIYASGGYPQRETVCLSASGEKVWSNNTKIYEPSLLAVNGCVFAVSDNGVATCWSAADGKEKWRQRLSGDFSASPVCCNDIIYVPNLAGKTFVFRATGDAYEEVAVNTLGADAYASPAIHQSRLYLRIGVGSGSKRKEQLCCLASSSPGEPSKTGPPADGSEASD